MKRSNSAVQSQICATLATLEDCLAQLCEEQMLLSAAHLEAAILALRMELMRRGIEPDANDSAEAWT